ncbi:MAG: DUF5666 domain-containing protein [Nitrospiraceae bacterium]|nr:DUF5666 domain-containing protein [Nitrospiraceae bacterium]
MKDFVRILAVFLILTFPVVVFADKDHDDHHDKHKDQHDYNKKSKTKHSGDYQQNNYDNYQGDFQNKPYQQEINQNEENLKNISSNDRKPAKRKFYGIVKKMTKGDPSIWTIDGQTVVVTRNTLISEKYGKVIIGRGVIGEGSYLGKNLVALTIETQDYVLSPVNPDTVNPQGRIDKIPVGGLGTWIVDGKEVYVSESTIIKQLNGKADVGVFVDIKGSYIKDVFKAKEIEVRK